MRTRLLRLQRLNKLSETKTQPRPQLVADRQRAEMPDSVNMAEHYRLLVRNLHDELRYEEAGNSGAVFLVRGLVRRVTVPPKAANENRQLGVEAGCGASAALDSRYCSSGCGGMQPVIQSWPWAEILA